jgi:phosphatidylserine/phosphatidylglycerophosphate/cardiolipin synthase-like enzyme
MNRIKSKSFKTKISTLVLLLLINFPIIGNDAIQKQSSIEVEVVTTIPVGTSLDYAGKKHAAKTWLNMINNASKSIDIAHFYLSTKKNEPLEPIIESIIKAADRGVRIRFLVGTAVNEEMAERTEEVLNRFKSNKNIEVTTFNWKPLTGGILHAKYFIVDNREAFVGSQNFDWRALKHIHETGLRIKSSKLISALFAIFEVDWQFNKGDKQAYKKMENRKADTPGEQLFLLSSPNAFNPPGIDALKNLVKAENIEVKYVEIPQYRTGFIPYARVIHSKVMRVDESISWVGTSNWGKRYFYDSRNIEVVTHIPKVAIKLDALFNDLWTSKYAIPIEPAKIYNPPRIR